MEIKPKFQFVEGSFDTQRVKLLCIPDDNHGRVDLCIKDPDCGWNIPIGQKSYSAAICTATSKKHYPTLRNSEKRSRVDGTNAKPKNKAI